MINAKNEVKTLFVSTTYTIENNVITFEYNTYTENFLNLIKQKNTRINIEISFKQGEKQYLILRDYALVNPRAYIEGVPPGPIDDYYTKTEVDNLFTSKADFDSLSGIVSGDIDNLATNYWTKQEVAAAIAQIQTMKIVVVQELPPIEEAEEYTVYLVPSSSSTVSNVYDEYLVINHQWECIGSTAVDLSQYALLSGGNTFVGDQTVNGHVTLSYLRSLAIGDTTAKGYNCLTLGGGKCNNWFSAAIGQGTEALGQGAYAIGAGIKVEGNSGWGHYRDVSVGVGAYNQTLSGLFIVGNGTSNNDRSDALVIDYNGNTTLSGTLKAPLADIDNITLSGAYPNTSVKCKGSLIAWRYGLPELSNSGGNLLGASRMTINNSRHCCIIGDGGGSAQVNNASNCFVVANGSGTKQVSFDDRISIWNETSNVFKVDNSGNTTLSGLLTAPSGNFDYITLSGSPVMPTSGTVDELNVTVKDYMFHEVPINVMNRSNATLTFGDNQWIKGTYGHRTIVTGKQYVQLSCPYNNLTLSESSFSLGGGNVGDFFRFPIHGNDIEKVGPFDVRGSVRWTGDTIETVSGTIFDPGMNKVLKHTLAEGESLTINRSISQNALVGALRTTKQFDFEIHLIQPSTAVNFTFDNTVIWGDGINFSSQNPEPSMNQANIEYCIVIRWDGTDLLANLAYTKEITA